MLTLGQAAKVTGKTKTAIAKAIANGRISATKDEIGQYQIDPAELHRVYPVTVEKEPKGYETRPDKTPEFTAEINGLKGRLEVMERLLAQIEGERDHLRGQVASLTALLPPPQKPVDGLEGQRAWIDGGEGQNAPTGKKTGFWGRLFGNAA